MAEIFLAFKSQRGGGHGLGHTPPPPTPHPSHPPSTRDLTTLRLLSYLFAFLTGGGGRTGSEEAFSPYSRAKNSAKKGPKLQNFYFKGDPL